MQENKEGNSSGDMMKLTAMIANVMPKEHIVEMLEKDIIKYKEDPTTKNWTSLKTQCILVLSKGMTEDIGVDKVLKDLDSFADSKKVHDNMRNSSN